MSAPERVLTPTEFLLALGVSGNVVEMAQRSLALQGHDAALRTALLAAEQERDEHLKWRTVEQEIGDKQRADLAALRAERDYLTLCLGEANASKEAAHGEVARLRAERDALVPLARWALFAISEAYARESNIVSRELLNEAERAGLYDPNDMDDVMDNMPKIIAARAVLGKEGT